MGCRRLTTYPKLCRGTPVMDEALMASYEPQVGLMWHGVNRVLSPDTPYAAACAQNAIYFIDLRYDIESAKHIKQQLERLVSDDPKGYYYIDEVDAIAERRDADGEAVFAGNPAYARVLFAESLNENNPDLKLPVHEPAGEWLVVYDTKNMEVGARAKRIGTGLNPRESTARSAIVAESSDGAQSELGTWKAAVDTPRFEGETDADYYQRMDKLHWG